MRFTHLFDTISYPLNIAHLFALFLTLTLYAVLAVAYLGWGKAATRLMGMANQATHPFTGVMWLGWAATILVLAALGVLIAVRVMRWPSGAGWFS